MGRRANIRRAHTAARGIFSEREWLLADEDAPPVASHVVASRGGHTHHGIYVGDGKVVHYAGLSRGWRAGPVEEVSLAKFARGRPVWVRPCSDSRFDSEEVVARARSRLGENCYRILSNNCEHFCEWCLHGQARSLQVEAWRTHPRVLVVALFGLSGRWLEGVRSFSLSPRVRVS